MLFIVNPPHEPPSLPWQILFLLNHPGKPLLFLEKLASLDNLCQLCSCPTNNLVKSEILITDFNGILMVYSLTGIFKIGAVSK